MNGDAGHFVAPRRETVARCMADAVAHAGLAPFDIRRSSAHATSTKVGDRTRPTRWPTSSGAHSAGHDGR